MQLLRSAVRRGCVRTGAENGLWREETSMSSYRGVIAKATRAPGQGRRAAHDTMLMWYVVQSVGPWGLKRGGGWLCGFPTYITLSRTQAPLMVIIQSSHADIGCAG